MGAMAKVAADQHEALQVLDAQYAEVGHVRRGRRAPDGHATALTQLGDYTTKLRAAEDSQEYTPAGVAARRKTLREPLVLAAERAEQRATVLERSVAKSEDEAWTSEIAPARDALDATMLIDVRNQLAAMPEPLRMPPLMDPGPRVGSRGGRCSACRTWCGSCRPMSSSAPAPRSCAAARGSRGRSSPRASCAARPPLSRGRRDRRAADQAGRASRMTGRGREARTRCAPR